MLAMNIFSSRTFSLFLCIFLPRCVRVFVIIISNRKKKKEKIRRVNKNDHGMKPKMTDGSSRFSSRQNVEHQSKKMQMIAKRVIRM
jgi:hypothetical protein